MKKILLSIFLLAIISTSSLAGDEGLPVSFVPVFANQITHYAKYGKGGWYAFNTYAAMTNLGSSFKEAGMAAFITTNQSIYILGNDLTTWTPLSVGGGGSSNVNQWSLYPAISTVNMAGYSITNLATNSIYFNDGSVALSKVKTVVWDSKVDSNYVQQYAYPIGNPSNYVNSNIITGLASTNWVLEQGYVTSGTNFYNVTNMYYVTNNTYNNYTNTYITNLYNVYTNIYDVTNNTYNNYTNFTYITNTFTTNLYNVYTNTYVTNLYNEYTNNYYVTNNTYNSYTNFTYITNTYDMTNFNMTIGTNSYGNNIVLQPGSNVTFRNVGNTNYIDAQSGGAGGVSLYRYKISTNDNNMCVVMATGTGITMSVSGTNVVINIPSGTTLLSMKLRWYTVQGDTSSFMIDVGTNDMNSVSSSLAWNPPNFTVMRELINSTFNPAMYASSGCLPISSTDGSKMLISGMASPGTASVTNSYLLKFGF